MTISQKISFKDLSKTLSLSQFRELSDCIVLNKPARFEILTASTSRIKYWAEQLNLNYAIGRDSFQLVVDHGMKNWASATHPCIDADQGAMRFVYFHPDKSVCLVSKNFDEEDDDRRLGQSLNYPICCINAYLKHQMEKEDADPIVTILDDFKFSGLLTTYFSPNPFTRYFGAGLFSHFPCSMDCGETRGIATKAIEALQTNFPKIAAKLLILENSLVIFMKNRGVYLWTDYRESNRTLELSRHSYYGQGEYLRTFRETDQIELSATGLILFSAGKETSHFFPNDFFIGSFRFQPTFSGY